MQSLYPILQYNPVTVSDFTVQFSHCIRFYSTNQSFYPILQYKSVTVSNFTVQICHCIPFYSTNQSLYLIIQYKSVTVSHFTVRLSHCMRLYSVTGKGSYLDIRFLSLIRILYNNVQVKHPTLTFVLHSLIQIPGILKSK